MKKLYYNNRIYGYSFMPKNRLNFALELKFNISKAYNK